MFIVSRAQWRRHVLKSLLSAIVGCCCGASGAWPTKALRAKAHAGLLVAAALCSDCTCSRGPAAPKERPVFRRAQRCALRLCRRALKLIGPCRAPGVRRTQGGRTTARGARASRARQRRGAHRDALASAEALGPFGPANAYHHRHPPPGRAHPPARHRAHRLCSSLDPAAHHVQMSRVRSPIRHLWGPFRRTATEQCSSSAVVLRSFPLGASGRTFAAGGAIERWIELASRLSFTYGRLLALACPCWSL